MTIQISTDARYKRRKVRSLYCRIWISGRRKRTSPASVTPFLDTDIPNHVSSMPITETPVEADLSFSNRCSQLWYRNNSWGPLITAIGRTAKNTIQKRDH